MIDPLSQVITLLRPRAVFTKGISGAGRWGVRYTNFGQPSFCTVIEGRCRLAVRLRKHQVDPDHVVAGVDQDLGDRRADEAGRAGEKDPHAPNLPEPGRRHQGRSASVRDR